MNITYLLAFPCIFFPQTKVPYRTPPMCSVIFANDFTTAPDFLHIYSICPLKFNRCDHYLIFSKLSSSPACILSVTLLLFPLMRTVSVLRTVTAHGNYCLPDKLQLVKFGVFNLSLIYMREFSEWYVNRHYSHHKTYCFHWNCTISVEYSEPASLEYGYRFLTLTSFYLLLPDWNSIENDSLRRPGDQYPTALLLATNVWYHSCQWICHSTGFSTNICPLKFNLSLPTLFRNYLNFSYLYP